MFNLLIRICNERDRNWDPIREGYAASYQHRCERDFEPSIIDLLDRRGSGLGGKSVLDLGGGPGLYSVEFARRGGHVVWHDVSRNYRLLAQEAARRAGVSVQFSLGHLEDATKLPAAPFDIVFSRLSWRYSMSDAGFAGMLAALAKPSGHIYVEEMIYRHTGLLWSCQYHLNAGLRTKIGHPLPPPGRIVNLMAGQGNTLVCRVPCRPDREAFVFERPIESVKGSG